MKKIALIGKPIRHSLSPLLFRLAYSKLSTGQFLSATDNTPVEIDGELFDYQIVEENCAKLSIQTLLNNRFIAANVTAPYKTAIMQYVTDCDEVTKILNATNLLLINDIEVKAYNTDYIAARNIAQRILQNISDIDRTKILFYVIGTGGAGKAAIKALVDLEMSERNNCLKKNSSRENIQEITVTNRSENKAAQFIKQFDNVKFVSFNNITDELFDNKAFTKIIFYTLPLHLPLYDQIVDSITSKNSDNGKLILVEPNYRIPISNNIPKELYVDGIEWLIEQAIYGFELMTGKKPDIEKMKKIRDLIK